MVVEAGNSRVEPARRRRVFRLGVGILAAASSVAAAIAGGSDGGHVASATHRAGLHQARHSNMPAGAEHQEPEPASPAEPAVGVPAPAPPPADRPIVAPAAFTGRRHGQAPPAALASAGPREGGLWAVMVGIDDYPGNDHDLRAAAADVRAVDAALAASGVPPDRRVLLLDGQATAASIRDSLRWLVTRAAGDAQAVFFYSGHVRQVGGDRDRDGEAVDEALVGADGGNILDGEMAEILRPLAAGETWLGIAGCYGAGFDDALAPGRVLTAAAPEDRLAYESSALGHSYLVEYMVRRAMLGGHAGASVQAAFTWARAGIERDYPQRLPVMVDRTGRPLQLGPGPASGRGSAPSGGPAPGGAEKQPAQQPPAAPAPTPDGGAPEPETDPAPGPAGPGVESPPGCTSMLAVTLCSQRASAWGGPVAAIDSG